MSNSLFVALLALIASGFRTRAALQAEILALRHQLAVLQANAPRHLRLQTLGSRVVASLVASLVRLASLSENRATGHSYRLAPQSFRLVLDTEIAAPAGKTGPKRGDSRLDFPP